MSFACWIQLVIMLDAHNDSLVRVEAYRFMRVVNIKIDKRRVPASSTSLVLLTNMEP